MCGGRVSGLILPNAQSAGEELWAPLAGRPQKAVAWGVKREYSIGRFEAGKAEAGETAGLLYLETVTPPCALWIAGAGHIAQAVAPLALQLDFSVTVLDDRPALANHQFFPREVSLHAEVLAGKADGAAAGGGAELGLVVTRGHRHDALVLRSGCEAVFLSRHDWQRAQGPDDFEHFIEEKLATPTELQRVACPVGMKLRSQSVRGITVSIAWHSSLISELSWFMSRASQGQVEKFGEGPWTCGETGDM